MATVEKFLLLKKVTLEVKRGVHVVWVKEDQTVTLVEASLSVLIVSRLRKSAIRALEVSDEVVSESRLASDQANERLQSHVLLDDLEVLLTDSFQTEPVAHDYQHLIAPI